MNKSYIYLLADEIDHITIQYREHNKKLDTKTAVDKMLYCVWAFESVKIELADVDIQKQSLLSLTDNQLHDILVRVRNVLLESELSKI